MAKSEGRKRVIVRLELTPSAKRALEGICDRNGMTQVSVSSRLVEWFAHQPEMLQGAILGHYPKEIQGDVAKMILARLTEDAAAGKA